MPRLSITIDAVQNRHMLELMGIDAHAQPGLGMAAKEVRMKRKFIVLLFALVLAVVLTLIWTLPAAAIQNGQPDGDDHPAVCLIVFHDEEENPLWQCSGTLISSTVVLTAAHATSYDGENDCAGAWVYFATDIRDTGYPDDEPGMHHGIPHTNPGFMMGFAPGLPGFDYHDVGVVVLDQAVPTSEVPSADYGQLPDPGIADTFTAMHPVDLVGYGVNYQQRGHGVRPYDAWQWLGLRCYAPAAIINTDNVLGSEFLMLTANPGRGKGGISFGDSGGPIFDKGTTVILGMNSFVSNANASGISVAQRVDIPDILAWIGTYLD